MRLSEDPNAGMAVDLPCEYISLHQYLFIRRGLALSSARTAVSISYFSDTLTVGVEERRNLIAQKSDVVATSAPAATGSVAQTETSSGHLNDYGDAEGRADRIRTSLWSGASGFATIAHFLMPTSGSMVGGTRPRSNCAFLCHQVRFCWKISRMRAGIRCE